MSVLRSACAAIQSIHPGCQARVSAGGQAEIQVPDAAALATALTGRPRPAAVQVGTLRLELAPAPAAAGPLSGQVALVTGAASGLGLGVARGLLQAGASVVFTDVDADGLTRVAAELACPERVHTERCDVTSEESVAAAFDGALARFGRLDGIACCAGVAPAFPLADFPLAKWKLGLEINLTGYFLCGREAARILGAQGRGGWMVLLSSKSGLEPSKNNSVYNATKAGELHLARGWALELGGQGIRVNCIAPGNVFKGSKIWNETYIAEAARKKGIRPDEVIPYYINLTSLKRDILPDDIANAAVFLASDAARCVTGQVLVVDSGQVWTR
ncbi:MAG: Sorbitol-6-phosphate 2-dehydrogenase [Planctomycetota bacterium]|jgi:NAD(P)-dependent dehydrogenase (short-subunit alcohol dehydrogenase family)